MAKVLSFSFSIGPYNEYSGLISFRVDWFDFLAVQGTLKSLPQHHSSKASILQHWFCSGSGFAHLYFDVNISNENLTGGAILIVISLVYLLTFFVE